MAGGVRPEGQEELPRILLLSVPYALKAGDAETLGGKPASAYTLNLQPTETAASVSSSSVTSVSAHTKSTSVTNASNSSTSKNAISAAIAGSGTTNYVPRWTSGTTLGNSILFQSSAGNLGIGTTTPAATLDIQKSTGIRVKTTSNGVAIFGDATVASGTGKGVEGDSSSTSGTGVAGVATATTGSTQGTLGWSFSTSGTGVNGQAKATSGNTLGVEGTVFSTSGVGVQGDGNGSGVRGLTSSPSGTAGVFNNTGKGKVLSGQVNGAEILSVNESGTTGMLQVTSNSPALAGSSSDGAAGTSSRTNGGDGIDAFGGGRAELEGRAGLE